MLTDNFTEEELNVAGAAERVKNSAKWLCQSVLEPLRAHFGKPVMVTSGYRATAQNTATGGVQKSYHLYEGSQCAADICIPGEEVADVFDWLRRESKLQFDKVILESNLLGIPQIVHVQADPTLTRSRTAWLGKTHGQSSYTQVECV